MNIVQRLKEYKKIKGEVKNTQARIENYRNFLKSENVELYTYVNVPDNLGMPRAPFNSKSPVESTIIEKELDRETVEQWIKDDESRIFWKKLEVEQIEIALDSLTEEQRFVIEKNYIDDWIWRVIEREFNEKFEKRRGYMTESGLKKINKEALKILEEILEPFYSQYNIA